MRLSEKTIELNICAQLNALYHGKIIWFGLTQKQEARAGFDTCTKLGGRLLLFQFKASNKIVSHGRKFYTTHRQLQNLIDRVKYYQRSVFYVFPLQGTTHELVLNGGDFISNSWLLDVATLPNPFPQPYTRQGNVRQNGVHYIYINPPKAIIHSEPVNTHVIRLSDFIAEGAPKADGIFHLFNDNIDLFDEFRKVLGRNSIGALLLPY